MKVCIIAPAHNWDDIRVFRKEARSLASAGYEVSLVARAPHPDLVEGVQVIPLPRPNGRLGRLAVQPLLLAKALGQKADIYHLHNLDSLPVLFCLRLLGRKTVYDTHEDFPAAIMIRQWIPGRLRRLISFLVGAVESWAGRVSSASIGTQPAVVERLGSRAVLIENPPLSQDPVVGRARDFAEAFSRQPDVFRLVYAGGMDRFRGLFTMISVVEEVNRTVPCRLWLAGWASETDWAEARRMAGWRWVDFLGRLPLHEAMGYIAASDAGLILLEGVGHHRTASPNKLFEYQLFGVPFIASAFPLWQSRFTGVDSGVFVNPCDIKAISEQVVWLAQHPEERTAMGEKGRRFIEEQYNWEGESRKLLQVYRRVEGAHAGAIA